MTRRTRKTPLIQVDDLKKRPNWWWRSCHLWGGTEAELRAFAASIGLPQEWAQRSKLRRTLHWDLSAAWRAKAVKAGAVETRG